MQPHSRTSRMTWRRHREMCVAPSVDIDATWEWQLLQLGLPVAGRCGSRQDGMHETGPQPASHAETLATLLVK
ncbi:hypothetical protein HG421_14415 [Xanthomonas campestris pv. badrii]|uniref:Uncharacterized protein n=1 Tax=Xanthomonas campestris pv. badrii TaxID=149696 RepID=A0A7Z2ZI21_XANCA|nr:hypothetical protein [Xanthomonas campestris]QJD68773.1 hypothetical protein HG421_14415 [Xanthomonas campestris pv. badrii]